MSVVSPPKRTPPPPPAGGSASATPRPAAERIDPSLQKQRDSDRRGVLEAELRSAEAKLAELKKDYADGQPERRGDERNYQKYLDRMAEIKDNIARYEADVQALKREIAKLP